MARHPFTALFARLRPPPGSAGDAATDAELLHRWASVRDPAAFELIVWRHGALVLGTCRRVARHDGDAEDAFQATFLILSRKAVSVTSLPGWLHRTARRAALKAAGRRKTAPLPAELAAQPTPDGPGGEALTHLDEAVNELGERHRRVVVLCYLQGHTADQAAKLLGVPRGTVLSRLATARSRLNAMLTARGVTLPVALLSATVGYDRVQACVALTLDPHTAAPAAAIAQGVLTMMLRAKLAATATALTAATALTLGVAGSGLALMPQPGGDPRPPAKEAKAEPQPPAAKPAEASEKLERDYQEVAKRLEFMNERLLSQGPPNANPDSDLISKLNEKIGDLKFKLIVDEMTKTFAVERLKLLQSKPLPSEIETEINFKIGFQRNYTNTTKEQQEKFRSEFRVAFMKDEIDSAKATVIFKNRSAGNLTPEIDYYTRKRDELVRTQQVETMKVVHDESRLRDDIQVLEQARRILHWRLLALQYDLPPQMPAGPDSSANLKELAELRAEVKRLRESK